MRRAFDPDEIIKAARGAVVEGLTDRIAHRLAGEPAWSRPNLWKPFCDARTKGYIVLDSPEWATIGGIWAAWCAAHGFAYVEAHGNTRMHDRWTFRLEPPPGKYLGPGAAVLFGKALHRLRVGCEPAKLGDRWTASPLNCWANDLDEATAHALAEAAVEIGRDPRCLSENIPWTPPDEAWSRRRAEDQPAH
ncbi:MAG: hypothetical protein QOF33_888 [Thermomicrobiales bacterium]|nr:hypothetical protein [Thermomicrobiales bacterium]